MTEGAVVARDPSGMLERVLDVLAHLKAQRAALDEERTMVDAAMTALDRVRTTANPRQEAAGATNALEGRPY